MRADERPASGQGLDDEARERLSASLPQYQGWELHRRLLSFALPYWEFGIYCMLGFMLAALGAVSMADTMQLLVASMDGSGPAGDGLIADWLFSGESGAQLWVDSGRWLLPCLIVLAVLARGAGSALGGIALALVFQRVSHDMRAALAAHMLRLPASFYDRSSVGFAVSRMIYNISNMAHSLAAGMQNLIKEGITGIALMAYLFYLQWQLTALFLLLTPPLWIILRVWSLRLRALHGRVQRAVAHITRSVGDIARMHGEIRVFDAAAAEHDRLSRASSSVAREGLKVAASDMLGRQVVQFIVAATLAIIVWFLLDPMRIEELSSGKMVAFLVASGMLARPVQQLLAVVSLMQSGIAAARGVFVCMDEPVEPDLGQVRVERARGQVDMQHLGFRYPRFDTPVLVDINLSAPPGSVVALVGRSGSGKTTLVSLLTRTYTGWDGKILLDGIPLQDYTLQSLRSQCSVVSQRARMLHDTVYNNVAYGALSAKPRDQVIAAAKDAAALDFIEALPSGWDTLIGEDGVLLSVGQGQRLLIARALLKDAPILILDEATASLDTESERQLQAALARTMRGRTTFVIAHRLSTVRNADVIMTLRKGHVVEMGTHAELLAAGGEYARLYRNQFQD